MCVHFRYGQNAVMLEAFLGSWLQTLLYLSQCSIRFTPSGCAIRICLDDPLPRLLQLFRQLVVLAFSVTPSPALRYGILHPLSIDYAFRPRLRSRLTQSGTNLPLETLGLRCVGFSPTCRYSHGILSSTRSTTPYGIASSLSGTLPYHLHRKSIASVSCLAPVNFGAESFDQ